jgi:hypothetical protein
LAKSLGCGAKWTRELPIWRVAVLRERKEDKRENAAGKKEDLVRGKGTWVVNVVKATNTTIENGEMQENR